MYYKGKSTSLMITSGKLRSLAEIVKILGRERLHDLGFNIPVGGKLTVRQAIKLNKELPSTSDLAMADDIELQEIMENAVRSMDNLIEQFEGQETEDKLHAR